MDHYSDIHLRPDPEFAAPHLMNALFGRLHLALVAVGRGRVGVSFPGFDAAAPHLGACLRLHGQAADLAALAALGWHGGLRDHILASAPQPVPAEVRFRSVRRVQAHSSAERIRRRQMRRHGYDAAEALRRIPDTAEAGRLHLPYVGLRSTSTGQAFRLFIEHGPLRDLSHAGVFSAYGLGGEATVPWF